MEIRRGWISQALRPDIFCTEGCPRVTLKVDWTTKDVWWLVDAEAPVGQPSHPVLGEWWQEMSTPGSYRPIWPIETLERADPAQKDLNLLNGALVEFFEIPLEVLPEGLNGASCSHCGRLDLCHGIRGLPKSQGSAPVDTGAAAAADDGSDAEQDVDVYCTECAMTFPTKW